MSGQSESTPQLFPNEPHRDVWDNFQKLIGNEKAISNNKSLLLKLVLMKNSCEFNKLQLVFELLQQENFKQIGVLGIQSIVLRCFELENNLSEDNEVCQIYLASCGYNKIVIEKLGMTKKAIKISGLNNQLKQFESEIEKEMLQKLQKYVKLEMELNMYKVPLIKWENNKQNAQELLTFINEPFVLKNSSVETSIFEELNQYLKKSEKLDNFFLEIEEDYFNFVNNSNQYLLNNNNKEIDKMKSIFTEKELNSCNQDITCNEKYIHDQVIKLTNEKKLSDLKKLGVELEGNFCASERNVELQIKWNDKNYSFGVKGNNVFLRMVDGQDLLEYKENLNIEEIVLIETVKTLLKPDDEFKVEELKESIKGQLSCLQKEAKEILARILVTERFNRDGVKHLIKVCGVINNSHNDSNEILKIIHIVGKEYLKTKIKLVYHLFSIEGDSALVLFQEKKTSFEGKEEEWKNFFTVMIDSGEEECLTSKIKHIKSILKLDCSVKCIPLDVIVISHWDSDHYKGFKGNRFCAEYVYCPGVCCKTSFIKENIAHKHLFIGAECIFGKKKYEKIERHISILPRPLQPDVGSDSSAIDFKILGVDNCVAGQEGTTEDEGTPINQSSISCLITIGEQRILTSGDLGKECDLAVRKYICSTLKIKKVQIVKANHHGSMHSLYPDHFTKEINSDLVLCTYLPSAKRCSYTAFLNFDGEKIFNLFRLDAFIAVPEVKFYSNDIMIELMDSTKNQIIKNGSDKEDDFNKKMKNEISSISVEQFIRKNQCITNTTSYERINQLLGSNKFEEEIKKWFVGLGVAFEKVLRIGLSPTEKSEIEKWVKRKICSKKDLSALLGKEGNNLKQTFGTNPNSIFVMKDGDGNIYGIICSTKKIAFSFVNGESKKYNGIKGANFRFERNSFEFGGGFKNSTLQNLIMDFKNKTLTLKFEGPSNKSIIIEELWENQMVGILEKTEIEQIESQINMECEQVVFASEKDSCESLLENIVGKSHLVFVIESVNGFKLGGYVNETVQKRWTEDKESFIFTFSSKKISVFEIKQGQEKFAFYVGNYNDGSGFTFGGYESESGVYLMDICVNLKNTSVFCIPFSFENGSKQITECESNWKRIQVIQMQPK